MSDASAGARRRDDRSCELRDMVETGRSMPMSASVLVNREEVARARSTRPSRRCPRSCATPAGCSRSASEFLAKARREADDIIEAGRVQAERMVERTEIVREARRVRPARRSTRPRRQARQLRHEAEDYIDQKLAAFEVVLERTMQARAEGPRAAPGRDRARPDAAEARRERHRRLDFAYEAELPTRPQPADGRGVEGAFFDQDDEPDSTLQPGDFQNLGNRSDLASLVHPRRRVRRRPCLAGIWHVSSTWTPDAHDRTPHRRRRSPHPPGGSPSGHVAASRSPGSRARRLAIAADEPVERRPRARAGPRRDRGPGHGPGPLAGAVQPLPAASSSDVVELPVDELFEPDPLEGETYPIEGHEIDLEQLVRDTSCSSCRSRPPARRPCAGPCADDVRPRRRRHQPRPPRGAVLSELEL